MFTKVPFRLSLSGGGTDIYEYFSKYGGVVIGSTIDKYCSVYMRRIPEIFGYKFETVCNEIQKANNINNIEHPAIRNVLKYFNIDNMRVVYDSDLPSRSGLGSSSAFIIAMIKNICEYKNIKLSKKEIATLAIYIERYMCGEDGGMQDQIEIAYGGLNLIEFNKEGFEVKEINMLSERKKKLSDNLFLVFAEKERLASDVTKDIKKNINNKIKMYNKLKYNTYKMYKILINDKYDIDKVGKILDENWKYKKATSSKITNSLVDKIYEEGKEAGAIGGRLIGAGSGGFFLFYVPKGNHDIFKYKMSSYKSVDFNLL